MSNIFSTCPVCNTDKTLITKMKVARTFDQIIIKEHEQKIIELEAKLKEYQGEL
jgi:hypothetical protein